ncbi:hypothetical protein HFN69_35080 [Rhizobium laguerreae]|uniref:hypothetical protein n=1 Tax=Rhizobium laguerreae TaxID=1076926 RepID=UPI001C9192E4|nr:hypothetical protein [Rhizobium laguerreae]MBY3544972.1 hypothetical protein [Rhizobium laguerreae]MBY3551715.1 hypothetical protein [Rhizobium laguerreae]
MSTTLFEILKKLDDARVHYHIGRYRSDTVDITATFVGKRLEISVFDDGHVEVSEFRGNEDVLDQSVLDDAISQALADDHLTR